MRLKNRHKAIISAIVLNAPIAGAGLSYASGESEPEPVVDLLSDGILVNAEQVEAVQAEESDQDTNSRVDLTGFPQVTDNDSDTENPVDLNQLIVTAQDEAQAFAPGFLSRNSLERLSIPQVLDDAATKIAEIVQQNDDASERAQNDFEDNPKDMFLNMSMMPWHEPNPINSIDELKEKFNADFDKNLRSGLYSCLNNMLLYSPLTFWVRYCKYENTQNGNFSIARDGAGWKLYKAGFKGLRPFDNSWVQRNIPYDLEPDARGNFQCVRQLTPKQTLLIVPSSYIGVGQIVSEREGADRERFPGAKNDMVLFQQGTYLVDETQYNHLHAVKYDASDWLTPLGENVAIINIPNGYIGGVREKATNDYKIIPPGKPVLIDRKEYVDPGIIDLKTRQSLSYMQTRPWNEGGQQNNRNGGQQRQQQVHRHQQFVQLLNLQRGQIAVVNEFRGDSYIIKDPGQYLLSSKEYNLEKTQVINLQEYEGRGESIIDAEDFYITLINPEQFGVVKNIADGKYKIIPPGRHNLDKHKWYKPAVYSLHQHEVVTDAAWVINVSPDLKVGAYHKDGTWIDFSDSHTGKRIYLSRDEYSEPVQFPRDTTDILNFGPFYYTMISGHVHVMLLNKNSNTIEVGAIGEQVHRMDHKILLEPLPKSAQYFRLNDLDFTSSDQYQMNVDTRISFIIDDPIKTMEYLRAQADHSSKRTVAADRVGPNQFANMVAHQLTADEFYDRTMSYRYKNLSDDIKDIAANQMRTILSYLASEQLTTDADGSPDPEKIKENRADIGNSAAAALQEFANSNRLGITVIGVSIESSPKFSDHKINEARAKKKLAQISQSQWEAQQRENKAREEAEAVAKIIAEETAQRLQEIKNQTALDEQKAQNEILLAKAEAEKKEKVLLAQAEAEKIRMVAEAEAEAEQKLNDAGKSRPEWRTNIESIEANGAIIRGLGEIQYTGLTPAMQAILNLGYQSANNAGGNGDNVSNLIGLSMLQQQMRALEQDQKNTEEKK